MCVYRWPIKIGRRGGIVRMGGIEVYRWPAGSRCMS